MSPRIATGNGLQVRDVRDLSDDEVATALALADSMDDEIRERLHGTTDASRDFLAAYAAAHESAHGAPWVTP